MTPSRSVNITVDAGAEPLPSRQVAVDPDVFGVLRLFPVKGRPFVKEDAADAVSTQVAILTSKM